MGSKKVLLFFSFIALFLSLGLNSQIIALCFVMIIVLINKDYLYVFLIAFPCIEVFLIEFSGFTATKFLGYYYVILFIVNMIIKEKVNINKHLIKYGLVLANMIIGIMIAFVSKGIISSYVDFHIISENLIYLSKILISVFLCIDFKQKNSEDIKNITQKIGLIIPWFFLLILINLIRNPMSSLHWGQTRLSLEGINANDLASNIAVLIPFIFILFNKRRKWILGLFALGLGAFSILLTLSRGGFMVMLIGVILSLVTISLRHHKSPGKVIFSTLIVITIFIFMFNGLVNDMLYRFDTQYGRGGISGLTTMRVDIWKNGISRTLKESPVFGFGSTRYAGISLNETTEIYRGFVMHNIFIEIFVRFGFLGIITFGLLFFSPLLFLFRKRNFINLYEKPYYLTLVLIFFSGFTLSWLFQESVWVSLGMTYGLMSREKELKL